MAVVALITDPAVVQKILNHLQLPAADPPRAPARTPSEPFEHMTIEPELDQEPDDNPFPFFPPQQRGPP